MQYAGLTIRGNLMFILLPKDTWITRSIWATAVCLPICHVSSYVPLHTYSSYMLTCIQEMPSEQGFWRAEELELDKWFGSFWPPAWLQLFFAAVVQRPWAPPLSRMKRLSDWPVCNVHVGSGSRCSRVPHEPALLVLHIDRTLTKAGSWWKPGTAAEQSRVLFFLSFSWSYFLEWA